MSSTRTQSGVRSSYGLATELGRAINESIEGFRSPLRSNEVVSRDVSRDVSRSSAVNEGAAARRDGSQVASVNVENRGHPTH
jgi:hypothetical protein